MTRTLRIDFAFPGDLAAPTGGYGYDRRVMRELGALGCDVRPIALPASFPNPTPADLAETARLLAGDARDALIVDGLAFGAFPADLVASLAPRPIALVHHPLFLETGLAADEALRLRATEQAALDHAAAVLTTSAMTADIVARTFSVPAARLFAAEPGVDPAPRARGSHDGIVRLIAVGSILPRKGYVDLVRALGGVTGDWRLRIAGSLDHAPDHARKLIVLVDELKLSGRIALKGALPAAAIADCYAAADVFVTSSYFEGYGMALAEAVACGLPIVATHEAAAAGAAPADATIVCPAGDIAALREALAKTIGDHRLRRRMSDCAWAAAATQPRWSDSARAILRAVKFSIGEAS